MVFGARPLKRVIQREILNPLAAKILSGEIREGSRVIIDRDDRRLLFKSRADVVGVS